MEEANNRQMCGLHQWAQAVKRQPNRLPACTRPPAVDKVDQRLLRLVDPRRPHFRDEAFPSHSAVLRARVARPQRRRHEHTPARSVLVRQGTGRATRRRRWSLDCRGKSTKPPLPDQERDLVKSGQEMECRLKGGLSCSHHRTRRSCAKNERNP